MPRVSIVIPTYNCDRFLGRAVDTALSQSYTDHEIIVVDDGSTDGTADLIAQYEQRVRYYRQSNRGVSAARNLALDYATGEFIAYLDADDMWYPQKLEAQVAFLDTHKECGLVHTEVSVIDEDDEILHLCFNQETKRSIPRGYCLTDLLRRCHIQTLTVMERRQCLDRIGGFDERLPIAQDYHHWIKVVGGGFAVGYLAEPLGKYRWRSGSLMANQGRLLEDLVLIYEGILQGELDFLTVEKDDLDMVVKELHLMRRRLAYAEGDAAKFNQARERIGQLIRKHPGAIELYGDFLKICMREILHRGRKFAASNSRLSR